MKFMEFSFKFNVVFVAGGETENKNGAAVAAVRFSSNIKVINEYQIKGAGELCYSLKRHENGNILFAGATSKVVILFFDGTNFELMAEYTNLPIGSITHMQIMDEELYCASPEKDSLLKIVYMGRGGANYSKDKVKVEKSAALQFAVGSKKAFSLTPVLSWMKISGASDMIASSDDKLCSFEKSSVKPHDIEFTKRSETSIQIRDAWKVEDGRIVALAKSSNTLKLFDKDLKEISYIKGKGKQAYPSEVAATTATSTDSNIFMWPMGDGYLGVVDVEKVEYDMIGGLGGLGGEHPLCHMMLASNNGRKVLTVSGKASSNSCYFSYWQKTEGSMAVTRSIDYLYSKRKLSVTNQVTDIHAFDCNADGSVFLLAGKSGKENTIIAGSFDGYFDFISALQVDAEARYIKRIHRSDYFFVGSVGKIYVVQLMNKVHVTEITSIKDLPVQTVRRIEADAANVYLLDGSGGKLATVHFNKPLLSLV